jgi:hypothetical protein
MGAALWPTELSRRGWPPRSRTARYLLSRQAPSTDWVADGGGPEPQRSRAHPGSSRRLPPGSFTIHARKTEDPNPCGDPLTRFRIGDRLHDGFIFHGGGRRTRIPAPYGAHPLSRRSRPARPVHPPRAESGRLERHGRGRAFVSSEARSPIGSLSILGYEPPSPGQLVLNSLPAGLGGGPKFEVLNPVVITLAVFVVNPLVRSERSAEMPFHHLSVLKDPPGFEPRANGLRVHCSNR